MHRLRFFNYYKWQADHVTLKHFKSSALYVQNWTLSEFQTCSNFFSNSVPARKSLLQLRSSLGSSFNSRISEDWQNHTRNKQFNSAALTIGKGPRVGSEGFPMALDIITHIRERGNLFDTRSTFQIADRLAERAWFTRDSSKSWASPTFACPPPRIHHARYMRICAPGINLTQSVKRCAKPLWFAAAGQLRSSVG